MGDPEKTLDRGTADRSRDDRGTRSSDAGKRALKPSDRAGIQADRAREAGGATALFDKLFPSNSRYHFDFQGGVTWGVPVRTAGHVRGVVSRPPGSDRVKVLVLKAVRLGLDTGVGAGVYFGGKKKGLGLDAGANLEAGVLGTVIEEYELPVAAVYSALATVWLDQAIPALMLNPASQSVGVFLDAFLSDYAERYLVKKKVETGAFAQGVAEATLGIKRPTDETGVAGKSAWSLSSAQRKKPGKRPKLASPDFRKMVSGDGSGVVENLNLDPLALLNFLSLRFTALVRGAAVVGVEQDIAGNSVKAYAEGELGVLLTLPIPGVSQLLSLLPSGLMFGVALYFHYAGDKLDKVLLSVYRFSGEDDYLAGPADRQELRYPLSEVVAIPEILGGLVSGQSFSLSLRQLFAHLESAIFWNRMSLGGMAGSNLRTFMRRQHGTRSLIGDEFSAKAANLGGRFELYAELTVKLTGSELSGLAEKLYRLLPAPPSGLTGPPLSDPLLQARALVEFLHDYGAEISGQSDELIAFLLRTLIVRKPAVYMVTAPAVGVGGKLGAGAKARGDIVAEVGSVCQAKLQGGTLGDVIRQIEDVLDRPLHYMPDCWLVKAVYAAFADREGEGDKPAKREDDTKTQKRRDRPRNADRQAAQEERSTDPENTDIEGRSTKQKGYERRVQELIEGFKGWKKMPADSFVLIPLKRDPQRDKRQETDGLEVADITRVALFVKKQPSSGEVIRMAAVFRGKVVEASGSGLRVEALEPAVLVNEDGEPEKYRLKAGAVFYRPREGGEN